MKPQKMRGDVLDMIEEGKISYGEDVQMAIAAILAAVKKAKQEKAKKQKTDS